MSANTLEISVCICTYKRPELLGLLLESLAKQTYPLEKFEVIVVDNDIKKSAMHVVSQASQRYPALAIRYATEPTQGISNARNKTVELATGKLLAFIDDDEWAVKNWLEDMNNCLYKYKCDGVLGPVTPEYPKMSKAWVINCGFFQRQRFITGESISANDCYTSNLLIASSKINSRYPYPFDIKFSLSGGEDTDYFKWLKERGGNIIWCNTAEVHETVPLSRQTLSYILKRCFRTSTVYWQITYAKYPKSWIILNTILGIIGGTILITLAILILPFSIVTALFFLTKGIKGFGRAAASTSLPINSYGDIK
ncbi:MAG: glycosyltransferase family 2 protein [Polaromonas sp.]|nr:glycosyltransferase family 2 protein [Polaromonas sp.]